MFQKSKIERDVDEIRLAIYEKTKDMTRDELNEYYRKAGEASVRKYGFKVAPAKVKS
jgi:hypothetical protein